MIIQKQVISKLFRTIITLEEELQAIRQLLNEEITFNIQSTFSFVASDSQIINLFSLRQFIANTENRDATIWDRGIQRMIKFYSNGKLQLGIDEWKTIFLSREDKLLAKLASEREDFQQETPNYLLSYCRKAIIKEVLLHIEIDNLQMGSIDSQKMEQICKKVIIQCSDDEIYLLKRYLRENDCFQGDFPFQRLIKIIKPKISNEIVDFLKKKQEQLTEKQNNKDVNNNPLIHKQFKKMGNRQQACNFLFRQAKSIEGHLNRNNSIGSSQLIKKISAYTSHIQNQLKIFFKYLRKIIKLNEKTVEQKCKLYINSEVNVGLIFSQISKNNEIIPSQLGHYLKRWNVEIPLQSIFLLFKRYCDLVTGKMNKKQFKQIFSLANPPQIKKTTKITPQFRSSSIICILNQIDCQTKIQELKRKLMHEVDLRQIFEAIDVGNHRKISQTDLKVIYRKIVGCNIGDDQLRQLWWRMKARLDELIDYDTFMYELIPRTK